MATIQNKRIALVVDDDALSREALVSELNSVGWLAYEACDEATAVEIFASALPFGFGFCRYGNE